jgi:hypothetical protein
VSARTLVQRSTPDDVLARVLGVLEGASAIGLAVGSLGIGVGASAFGLGWAIAATAVVLPIAVVASWSMLGRADTRAAAVDPDLVSLLRQVDFFSVLGPAVIAQLALNLRPVRAAPGDEIIRMGDVGDRFYVIAEGSVLIHRGEESIDVRVPGDHIGETALVLGVPRTASVTARESTLLYRLGREPFLEAVTGHSGAHHRAHQVSVERNT